MIDDLVSVRVSYWASHREEDDEDKRILVLRHEDDDEKPVLKIRDDPGDEEPVLRIRYDDEEPVRGVA